MQYNIFCEIVQLCNDSLFLGYPYGSAGKESSCNVGGLRDLGLILGLGKAPGEEKKATHSSILALRIPWGHIESDTTEQLSLSFFYSCPKLQFETNNKHPTLVESTLFRIRGDSMDGWVISWNANEVQY